MNNIERIVIKRSVVYEGMCVFMFIFYEEDTEKKLASKYFL